MALAHRSAPERGEVLFRADDGTVWTTPTVAAEGNTVSVEGLVATWRDVVLDLSIEEARALFDKLELLFKEAYERGSSPSGRPYTLQVTLVPYVAEECEK